MLKKLTIENFALVDNLTIDFGPGLTVLTGETGAGKSVIIGGLALALGGRADRDLIRHGTDKSSFDAVFDLPNIPPLKKKLGQELGFPAASTLSFAREIVRSGTSRCFIDGAPAILGTVRKAAPLLIDFYSQQGHHQLLDIEQHRRFLDSFAGTAEAVERLAGLYHEFTSAEKQLLDAQNNAAAMRDKLELINFQLSELSQAGIRIGEEEELDNERRRLESVRALMETGRMVMAAVNEDDNSVIAILSALEKQLKHSAAIDRQLEAEASLLSEAVINLNEVTRNLESYLSRLTDNPERLDEINARMGELFRLRRKYGADEAGLLDKLEQLKKQSLGATDVDILIKNLTRKAAETRNAYYELASEVSSRRKAEAPRLEKQVEKQLADLAISRAQFRIDFQTEYDDNGFEIDGGKVAAFPHGLENIEFMISTNPNEPLKPLVKIASGGEISRIMLALLTVIAGKYHLPTVIFDEIDTGIGGITAVRLGEKLKELSKRHQVIAISHLSAVASQADHHLAVSKELKNGRNIISVKEIKGAELKQELARMAGRQK